MSLWSNVVSINHETTWTTHEAYFTIFQVMSKLYFSFKKQCYIFMMNLHCSSLILHDVIVKQCCFKLPWNNLNNSWSNWWSDMQSVVKIGKQNVHVGMHVMTTLVDHQNITCESRVLILLKGFEWKESLRFSPCFFTVNEVAGGY